MYRFKNPTVKGRLIRRLNRFVAAVEVDGEVVYAHVANSGRMKELLFPGNSVVLERQQGAERKTPYDLILAEHHGNPVSIDSRLPNYLVAEAIERCELPGLEDWAVERREVVYGESRLDLKLAKRPVPACSPAEARPNAEAAPPAVAGGERGPGLSAEGFAEVKSCTLVRDGIALFPDAPTERGTRHLRELIRASREGFGAYVIFLIQRDDARAFRPNDLTDPDFGRTLREAAQAGVQVRAYTCRVTEEGVRVAGQIPIQI